MKLKIDVKDRKLLYQLDLNARQPNSILAKNVGISKQVCGLRLKRFEKEKLITTFYPVIDIARLGFTNHKNFLRLHNIDQHKEQELIHWLKNHRNVVWLSSCDGMFDLAFGTWARDMVFLDQTLTELNQKFGQYIAERQIATIIRGEYFVRDYLIGKKASGHRKESFFGSTPNPIKMDENDWEILRLLALDCRENVTQLARKVGLSADAATQRIRKLEVSGVIKHYNFVPNESAYPYLHYKVLISLRNINEEKYNQLVEFCRVHPNIVYIVKALGPWDFEADLEVESVEEFRRILMDLKNEFSEIIRDYSSLQIYQVHKYNFCPSVPK